MKADARSGKTTQEDASCDLRLCAQCGNPVTDPLVTRCPRCWAALPRMSCGGCKGCPVGRG